MDFNEASQSYVVLRQQLTSGAITSEHYQQEAAKLRFVTPDGVWWQIDPATGAWLTWNGQTWIPATAAGKSVQKAAATETSQAIPTGGGRHGRRPPRKQEPAPQTLWQLAVLMVKSWVENLPLTVTSSILTACATWFFHTWLLVGPNNTIAYPTKPILGWMLDTVQNPRGGVAFWAVASYFVTTFVGRLFSAPLASAKGIVLSPSWLVRAFRSLRARALIPFLLGGTVAVVIGSTMRNYMSAWAYAAGFLLITMALDMSFEHMVLRLALSDLRRYLKVRLAPYGAESDYVFLLFPGLALGFAASAMPRTPARWAQFTFWGALVIVLVAVAGSMLRRRKATRTAGALLLFLALACTVAIALTPVLADDSGWAESGRTIQGLTRNAGWPIAKKLGIPPAQAAVLAGLLATNLGAAYGYMKKHGIDPRKLGLPDTPPPPGMNVAPGSGPRTPQQIADDIAKAQAEAAEANTWGGLLGAAWDNWSKDAIRLGDLSGRAADAVWNGVKGAANVLGTVASDVWNHPGKYWDGFTRDVGAVWDGVKDAAAHPLTTLGILSDTVTGTVGDVLHIGWNVGTGIVSGVWTTLTDPAKAWDFVKESVGWNNWNKILDPSIPIEERIGNVLAGTVKLGFTLATLGQAKAWLAAKNYAADAAAVANGTFTATEGIPKGASGLSGYIQRIQKVFGEFGVEGSVRPPNIARIPGGVPKPSWLKNKSLDFIDQQIGAKGMEGGIGHYMPDQGAVDSLLNKIASNPELSESAKETMRSEVLAKQAARIEEFKANEAYIEGLKSAGKVEVKGGMIVDAGTGKPFTGDVDLFHLKDAATGAPVSQQTEQNIIKELERLGVPVTDTHGAHLNWVPKNEAEWKTYNDVIAKYTPGGQQLVVIGSDSIGGASFTPGGVR